jgi:hypothetical protein
VTLSDKALLALDEASAPTLNFPAAFLKNAGVFGRGGTTVNGETYAVWPLSPKSDAERY